MATRSRRPRGLSANHVNEAERLQMIMNDKATLSSVRLLDKENWVKVDQRPNCFYCARKFRPFSIKRHCRSCGEIVCSNCYRRRRVKVTPTLEITARLCFDCIDKAMLITESESPARILPDAADSSNSNEEIVILSRATDDESECKQDGKQQLLGDSLKTSSSSTGTLCGRFSDMSGYENWSDVEDDASDTSSLGGSSGLVSQRGSRRGPRSVPATNVIEFLPEQEQFEIYETRRQEILAKFNILDTEPEQEYDAICELVRKVLECPVAAVAFMDRTRQWYKSRYGIAQAELPREIAMCSQLLQTPLPTIVMDATKDPRFSHNPLVTGSASIRFYASTPICDPTTGIIIGSVFVMDPNAKQKLPLRTIEVLSYASSAVEKLLQGEGSMPVPASMKQKRHSSPSIAMRRESLPPFPEIRAASLQSVPEEIDSSFSIPSQPRSNNSSMSSSTSSLRSSRGKSRRRRSTAASTASTTSTSSSQQRYQLLDPDLELPSSDSSRPSNSKLCVTDLVSAETADMTTFQQPTPDQLQNLNTSCIELFHRITSTQQMLVQQHDALLATLTQHSSRISSIEHTVGRIEDILSVNTQYATSIGRFKSTD